MALINRTKKEINAKIAYFGPASSGKATSLEFVYKRLKPEYRGKLKAVSTQGDRMLFFDFTPAELGGIDGFTVRFHLYTAPGEVSHDATWKMVLKGVDGVVFMADSRPEMMAANVESMRRLKEILAAYNVSLSGIPCLVLCNKQDLPGAVPMEEMQRMLGTGSLPLLPAVAARGEGVLPALSTLVKSVLKKIREADLGLPEEGVPVHVEETMEAEAATEEFPALGAAPIEAALGAEETVPFEPEIELLGEAEVLGGGRLRIPVAVKFGGREKRLALNVSLAFEAAPEEE